MLYGSREAHNQLVAVAGLPPTLARYVYHSRSCPDSSGEAIPQRTAETALAHEDLLSARPIEEADPDSVLYAVDAMLQRLQHTDTMPTLTIETEEGDRWPLADGGPRVYGDREDLALRLSRGESGNLSFEKLISAPPAWA